MPRILFLSYTVVTRPPDRRWRLGDFAGKAGTRLGKSDQEAREFSVKMCRSFGVSVFVRFAATEYPNIGYFGMLLEWPGAVVQAYIDR